MYMPVYVYIVLFFAGLFAGVINTVGGGGSVLTLPALIFAGIPAGIANATNRIGIIIQNLVAIRQFRKGNAREDHLSARVVAVGLAGSVLGARLASLIPDREFERILGVLMLVLLAMILSRPRPRLLKNGVPEDAWSPLSPRSKIATLTAFFFLGIYAGFLQAGVGIMILVALGYLVRMDLVRGNYVKLVFVFVLNLAALATFLAGGIEIEWVAGIAITAGQALGAALGSWIAIRKGERWILWILTVAIVLSSAKLLGLFELLR